MDGVKQYLTKHRVPELLEHLTMALVYNRPENPEEFILEELTRMKAVQDAGEPLGMF